MKFTNAKEMLETIQDGTDLYCPAEGTYVWLYNSSGSIAAARISEEELIEAGHKMAESGDDTLIYEELQGLIYDDPSYDGFDPLKASNIQYCENNYAKEWVEASDYIVPRDVEIGTIEVDVVLKQDGYDVYLGYNGSSGCHYSKKTAADIGAMVAADIDIYANTYQQENSKKLPIPKVENKAVLVYTDGYEISHMTYPSYTAANDALRNEYQENYESCGYGTGEEPSSEEEMSYVSDGSATLYTGDGVLIWKVIEV